MFVFVDSFFEFAQSPRPDSTPGPQAAGLSIEGRAVPDYVAPFNIFGGTGMFGVSVSGSAGILPAFFHFENESWRDAGAPACKNYSQGSSPYLVCFP